MWVVSQIQHSLSEWEIPNTLLPASWAQPPTTTNTGPLTQASTWSLRPLGHSTERSTGLLISLQVWEGKEHDHHTGLITGTFDKIVASASAATKCSQGNPEWCLYNMCILHGLLDCVIVVMVYSVVVLKITCNVTVIRLYLCTPYFIPWLSVYPNTVSVAERRACLHSLLQTMFPFCQQVCTYMYILHPRNS